MLRFSLNTNWQRLLRPRKLGNAKMETNALEHDTLVAVVGGLEGTVDGDVEVLGLLIGESGELDVELSKMSASDLLVQLLGEHVNAESELTRVGPESDLSEDLVGEGARHDERWVTGGTATGGAGLVVRASDVHTFDLPQVDETTLSKKDDVTSTGHGIAIDLRLDVDNLFGVGLQPGNIDFNVEVANAGIFLVTSCAKH